MSYQVIARKFRPQSFEDLIGQQHVATTLRNAIELQRIPHAFLFTGTRGVGKTSAARILAKALNCTAGPTATPCNTCQPCREITEGKSIDVLEIDGASNRGIDEIRNLREMLNYLPSSGKFRIYIIDEVHMLTQEAFNALLKTLEEPPAHVKFILATTEVHKIPITILSRCQRYDFRKIPLAMIVEHLSGVCAKEEVRAGHAELAMIARESGGSMRDAQSLLDQAIAFCGKDLRISVIEELLGLFDGRRVFDFLQALAAEQLQNALKIIEAVDAAGHDLHRFCLAITQALRDLLILSRTDAPELVADRSSEELTELRAILARCGADFVELYCDLFLKTSQAMGHFDQPRLMLEIAAYKASTLRDLLQIGQAAEQLEKKKT